MYNFTILLSFHELKGSLFFIFNPMKTSPEYARAGVYGTCMLYLNQIVLKRVNRHFCSLIFIVPGMPDFLQALIFF